VNDGIERIEEHLSRLHQRWEGGQVSIIKESSNYYNLNTNKKDYCE